MHYVRTVLLICCVFGAFGGYAAMESIDECGTPPAPKELEGCISGQGKVSPPFYPDATAHRLHRKLASALERFEGRTELVRRLFPLAENVRVVGWIRPTPDCWSSFPPDPKGDGDLTFFIHPTADAKSKLSHIFARRNLKDVAGASVDIHVEFIPQKQDWFENGPDKESRIGFHGWQNRGADSVQINAQPFGNSAVANWQTLRHAACVIVRGALVLDVEGQPYTTATLEIHPADSVDIVR